MPGYLSLIMILFYCTLIEMPALAQLPVCDKIYLKHVDTIIDYNPSLPLSPTNPRPNTIIAPESSAGLTIAPALHSGSGTLTFYTIIFTGKAEYAYYDPGTGTWLGTGHSTGSTGAVNIAAGGDYIFSLDGTTGEVYRYDGSGNGVLIATVPGVLYDLVADCEGNWYVFNQAGPSPFLRKYSFSGILLHSWVLYNPLGLSIKAAAGFAITGTTLYTDNALADAGGIAVFTLGKDTITVAGIIGEGIIISDDMGSCSSNIPLQPQVNISTGDTIFCSTAHPVTLTARIFTGGPGPKYQWRVNNSPAGTDSPVYTYTPADGDKVTCTMTSNAPCASPPIVTSNVVSFKIYGPVTFSTTPDTAICYKDSITLRVNTDMSHVHWTLVSGSTGYSKEIRVSPEQMTQYPVIVFSDYPSCFGDARGSVTVSVLPLPEVSGFDTLMHLGQPVQLSPIYGTEVTKWKWLPAEGLDCPDCANPIFQTVREMSYLVSGTDANGCSASDSVRINVFCKDNSLVMPNAFTPNDDGRNDLFYCYSVADTINIIGCSVRNVPKVDIPNAFTPNGDGKNDVFRLKYLPQQVVSFTLKIYNRYGQMISELKSRNDEWDGGEYELGVYYYLFMYKDNTGKEYMQKGDISLVR